MNLDSNSGNHDTIYYFSHKSTMVDSYLDFYDGNAPTRNEGALKDSIPRKTWADLDFVCFYAT